MNEYNPHREVSIDEAMIGFSGRLGFKQLFHNQGSIVFSTEGTNLVM
jgi:hypothetical protein